MRLKSLKLAGFKSFANATTFSFKHDITAIVGPNGCGKSNVIDAIRWVLGETSAKQLRGGAMSDVIFAGTDGKAGKSLASVELTFEHTQDEKTGIRHPLNLYQELTLRRQITIEGKSDYFINGQKVRRRDVVDVFLGTGLGARSYAVIEQGMIGRIIDADGQRLREFIEEAAGVSRYQARRDETEKQLDKAQENLERLNDLESELQKQHKSLIRQAEAAKKYQAWQDDLHKVEQSILTHKLYDAWQVHSHAQDRQKTLGQKLVALNGDMAKLKSQWDSVSSQLGQIQWQKDEAKEKSHNAKLAHQAATHALEHAQHTIAQYESQLEHLAKEDEHADGEQQKRQSELSLHQSQIATLTPTLDELTAWHTAHKDDEQNLKNTWQDVRLELDGLYHERQNLQNGLNLNQANLKRIANALQKCEQKKAALDSEQKNLDDSDVTPDKLDKLQQQYQQKQHAIAALEDDLQDDKQKQNALAKLIEQNKTALNDKEKQHSRLSSEYDTLHKLVYPPKPLPTKNKSKDSTTKLDLPSLKDELSLSKQGLAYVAVLDKFLSILLDDGVADDLGLLQVLQSDGNIGIWQRQKPTPQLLPDGFVSLATLIATPSLALWHDVSVFDDTAHALPVNWDNLPTTWVITTSGWLVSRFGAVHYQKFGKTSSQFLSQRQAHLDRLTELEDELTCLETLIDEQQNNTKNHQADYENLSKTLDDRQAHIRTLTLEYNELKHEHTKLGARLAAFHKDKQRLSTDRQQLIAEQDELRLEEAQTLAQKQLLEDKLADLLPRIDTVKKRQDELSHAQNTLGEQLGQKQAQIQTLSLQLQSHRQAIHHIHEANHAHSEQSQKRHAQKHTLNDSIQALQNQLPSLVAKETETAKLAHESDVASQTYDTMLSQYQNEQHKLQTARSQQQEAIDKMNADLAQVGADVAVALARLQDLGQQLGERVADFNLTARLADFAHANFDPKRDLGGDLASLTSEQKRLAGEIGKLGAVNLTAAAELDELENRLNPMQKEIDDVKNSIATLKNAIDTINQKTKKLFLEMLASVNRELNALFANVFGGGQASLSLMDDDTLPKADKWRAGLVLMAQPKGKKNSRLAVLSGGEKTLTALSLIFAIFKQNPAPFCVLDEVDAPLDDANVGRFTGLISELALDVQFIFISHNKLAMQSANELKGVTMPTAGISTLVSVNLNEAMAMVG